MLKKNFGFQKSKTKNNIRFTAPQIQSTIKLDSFLNFSKLSNESKNSINTDNNNNLIIKTDNRQKPKNKHSSIKKSKKVSLNKDKKYHKHPYCMDDLNKSLNKNKSALSEYILTNTSTKNEFCYPNIKLLGNSRYKYTSPIMFVEDQKNKMTDKNLGLVPIPMERCKVELSEKEENEREKKLYELQRSIVMLRRRQYNNDADKKKLRNQFIDYNSNSLKNEIDDISEYINKIVIIQKWWNNYRKKNEMKNKINKLEEKLKCFVDKRIFNELKKYLIKYNRPLNFLCYIKKIRYKYIYQETSKENIEKNNDENSLNSIELNDSSKKDTIINNNNKNQLKYQKYKEEIIENSNNELDENSLINEINVNDENNNIELKNLEIKENDLSSRNNEDKNVKLYQKYTPENFYIFSDFIKKIVFLQLINKFKDNEKIPGMTICEVKPCFISKIRKLSDKRANFLKNQKIERIQFHIDYINNKIYKLPINNENKNISRNAYYISKVKIDKKVQIERINYLPMNESENAEKLNEILICINKDCFRNGFFLSKIIKKRNYMKLINIIQKYYKSHLNKNKNKEFIFSKPLANSYYYITKKRYVISNDKIKENKNNLNYLILLLNLFITKNIKEYIFQILKVGKTELISNNKFYYPFYIRTIQRILNYIKKNENPNKKISLFFNEIFNIQKTKVISVPNLIIFLPVKIKNKLINSNLFTGYEENDLINFMTDFSEFDKNINNETFIIERLKRINLNDTNIFTLVKLIDNEFNNLVKGKYCLKCYNDIEICGCNKENNIKEIKNNSSDDVGKSFDKSEDNLNFDDLSDDADNKRQIHFFDYNIDDNVDNNILIKTKTTNNDNKNQKLFNIILPKNINILDDK